MYGFTVDNKIFLTDKGLDLETPIHEYTHLWIKGLQYNNPKLYNKIKDYTLLNAQSLI